MKEPEQVKYELSHVKITKQAAAKIDFYRREYGKSIGELVEDWLRELHKIKYEPSRRDRRKELWKNK